MLSPSYRLRHRSQIFRFLAPLLKIAMVHHFALTGLVLSTQLLSVGAVPVDEASGLSLVAREANFIRYAGWYVSVLGGGTREKNAVQTLTPCGA